MKQINQKMTQMAKVTFQTNVDCCKQFMGNISSLPIGEINPLVGDKVRVYHDNKFELYMQVKERTWTWNKGWTNDSSHPVLVCYLGPCEGWSIAKLVDILKERGFQTT